MLNQEVCVDLFSPQKTDTEPASAPTHPFGSTLLGQHLACVLKLAADDIHRVMTQCSVSAPEPEHPHPGP